MADEKIRQEIRLKNIDETRSYLIEEKNWNELTSKKNKKVCTTLSCIKHFLILCSTITGCISITAFASLFDIPSGVTSSLVGFKMWTKLQQLKSIS